MKTFTDVIDRWPTVTEFAKEVGATPNLVSQWRKRNSIPSNKWLAVIAAAKGRGYPIDATTLAKIANRRTAA